MCSQDHVSSHALAGFFGELVQMKDSKVAELMQSWGIYYRQLPLETDQVEVEQTEAGIDAS